MTRWITQNRYLRQRRTAIVPAFDAIVWLRADDLLGTLVDDDPVPSWTDRAMGESFSQASAGNQPTFKTNVLNGRPAVRFNGTDDHLDGVTSRTLKPVTIFAVVTSDDVGSSGFLVGNVGGNAALAYRTISSKQNIHDEGIGNIGSSTTNLVNGVPFLGDVSYSAAGVFLFGLDGADDGGGTNDRSVNPSAISLGARDSDSTFWDGDVHELLIFNYVTSAAKRSLIRNYLLDGWGI